MHKKPKVDNFIQYMVKLDSSGRISLRNRTHIRPLLHNKPHLPQTTEIVKTRIASQNIDTRQLHQPNNPVILTEHTGNTESFLRRSTRSSKPPERYGEWDE